MTEVVEEDFLHLATGSSIPHHECRLIVQCHRAVVEVHRSDREPLAVDDERLGVQRRGLPLVYPYAGREKRSTPRASRQPDDVDVRGPAVRTRTSTARLAAAVSSSMSWRLARNTRW
jgi:hypothetical protein